MWSGCASGSSHQDARRWEEVGAVGRSTAAGRQFSAPVAGGKSSPSGMSDVKRSSGQLAEAPPTDGRTRPRTPRWRAKRTSGPRRRPASRRPPGVIEAITGSAAFPLAAAGSDTKKVVRGRRDRSPGQSVSSSAWALVSHRVADAWDAMRQLLKRGAQPSAHRFTAPSSFPMSSMARWKGALL